jgi:asparagine synthase (glutamine-hydrolysing)
MEVLFGALLPPRVVTRPTKAVFTQVFVGPASRAFVGDWDGSGIDHSLVDADVLREVWSSDGPRMQSLTMLQAAWLTAQPQS